MNSKVTVAVSKCFGELFTIPHRFSSILQAMAIWMAPFKSSSQYGICRLGVAAYVLREIWVSRCRATLDGTSMRARDICLKVMYRTQILTLVNNSKGTLITAASHCVEHYWDLEGTY